MSSTAASERWRTPWPDSTRRDRSCWSGRRARASRACCAPAWWHHYAPRRAAPIIELGTTTPRVAEQLVRLPADAVVVVDQFEELFTDSRSEVAEQELEALATWRGSLAITLRSDHLDRLNGVAWLAELAERSLLLLGHQRLKISGQRSSGRPSASGLRLEPGLVELVLRDRRTSPVRCPSCRMRSAPRGSAARAARSPSTRTSAPADCRCDRGDS